MYKRQASISIICGGASPGVEPIAANSYTHKTLSGSFNVRNKHLERVLEKYNKNNDEVFVFNGWMFSSSPSITPFDHPIYDVWLVKCY